MVTLNNGQKPMTARHQIEILAESIYDFTAYSFKIITEKENFSKYERAFKKADMTINRLLKTNLTSWLQGK